MGEVQKVFWLYSPEMKIDAREGRDVWLWWWGEGIVVAGYRGFVVCVLAFVYRRGRTGG